ncbi:MAG: GC-type dockerin domain-anchored protein [Planctomycetota bacterium]
MLMRHHATLALAGAATLATPAQAQSEDEPTPTIQSTFFREDFRSTVRLQELQAEPEFTFAQGRGGTGGSFSSALSATHPTDGWSFDTEQMGLYRITPVFTASGDMLRFEYHQTGTLTPHDDATRDVVAHLEIAGRLQSRFQIQGLARYDLRYERTVTTPGAPYVVESFGPRLDFQISHPLGHLVEDAFNHSEEPPSGEHLLIQRSGYFADGGVERGDLLLRPEGLVIELDGDPEGDDTPIGPLTLDLDVTLVFTAYPVPGCSLADLANFDGDAAPDGQITLADFARYLTIYEAGGLAADLTSSGVCEPFTLDGAVTLEDFSCFLALWSEGCVTAFDPEDG